MPNNGDEPILSYPSRASVVEALTGAIERSSDAELPNDRELYECYYEWDWDSNRFKVLHDAVNAAISQAEPAPWLSRYLEEFQQMIVEYAIENLNETAKGRSLIDEMRAYVKDQTDAEAKLGDTQ